MKRPLKVATLNYSGILLSPFQFYSDQLKDDEKQLSKVFTQIIKIQFPDFNRQTFKWNLGKIDQKMQIDRYTPIYRQNAGINNDILNSEQQFKNTWNKQFKEGVQKINSKGASKTKVLQYTDENMNRTLCFDLMCYKAILAYVYKVKNLHQIFSEIDLKDSLPYKEFMLKFFKKAFLRQDKKIQKIILALDVNQIDVLFLQQTNNKLIDAIPSNIYKVITQQNEQSSIIVRKSKFKQIYGGRNLMIQMNQQFANQLDWNKDTVIVFADQIVLLSGHLSSKKQHNATQVFNMLNSLRTLKKIYPQRHIIVGVDANSFVTTIQFPNFESYPKAKQQYTTSKTRTMLQPQVNKADQKAMVCRDSIISDMILSKTKIISISGKSAEEITFLPCQEHPYDHFAVIATVNR